MNKLYYCTMHVQVMRAYDFVRLSYQHNAQYGYLLLRLYKVIVRVMWRVHMMWY